eukprot:TRINITY_DN1832_c0_g1_i1.p1 TRINITY_DN1832_c0_g1~~TRINITY_DN1832_c0_g1_i1.p1  ORF type:complete len:581 (-),score=151.54 TRINITY_DN1832_c0_g1_i1:46-1788(-)
MKSILIILFFLSFFLSYSHSSFLSFPSRYTQSPSLPCSNLTTCELCSSSNLSCFWCSSTQLCFSPSSLPPPANCSSGLCQSSSCSCTAPCTDSFYPCSDTISGILILLFFYGVLLAFGAKFISDGSELLLEILPAGIIGGVLIPFLGAVPDTAIVLVSGALGTVSEAQENIAVGVGTLAGSTIMLLTIPWCASLFLARTDIKHGQSVDGVRTKFIDFVHQGTSVDEATKRGGIIMVITSVSYLIIQVVAFVYIANPEGEAAKRVEKWFALAGMVFCGLALLGYLLYQIYFPELQTKKINAARENHRLQIGVNAFLSGIRDNAAIVGTNPSQRYDSMTLGDGSASTLLINTETRSGRSKGSSSNSNEEAKMRAAMVRHYGLLWRSRAKERSMASEKYKNKIHDSDEEEEEGEKEGEVKTWKEKAKIIAEAGFWLLLGTGIVTAFSDPMVEVITDLGVKLNIGAFFVSFLIVPFCSNASELISSLIFASRRKRVNSSLTYSALYGAATMNNTLVLGVFYALIFFRGLAWDFSAEVISIWFVTLVVGAVSLNLTYRLFFGIIVVLLYPASIGLVAILNRVGFH